LKIALSLLVTFFLGILIVKIKPTLPIAGIVPHHDVANILIDNFFQKFKTDKKINVYLIGPDHTESNSLNDQSITVPSEFIKKYLPNSKIIPCVLKRNTSISELESFSNKITSEVKKGNTIIIASVDFSHNLTSKEADKRDEVTFQAIKDFDYQKLMSLNSEYLDSPASIVALLITMESLGKKNFEILSHTNSAKLLGPSVTNTTSYFTIIF
jgi:MEMO1 family protein